MSFLHRTRTQANLLVFALSSQLSSGLPLVLQLQYVLRSALSLKIRI